jgi:hypothetical protein
MRSKHITILVGLIVTATVLFSGGGMAVAQDNSGNVGAQACVAPCLYDQLTLGQPNGSVSQNFEATFNTRDNQSADDFTIPAGTFFWSINQVALDGLYNGSGFQATSVNVFFYNSAGSLPGTSVYQASFVPAGLSTGDFVISLNPPAGLLAGKTYWLSVQANLDSGGVNPAHQWYWGLRGPGVGNAAAWINPGDGFFTGCTTWNTLTNCGITSGNVTDLQFRLSGTQVNIAATVYLPSIRR